MTSPAQAAMKLYRAATASLQSIAEARGLLLLMVVWLTLQLVLLPMLSVTGPPLPPSPGPEQAIALRSPPIGSLAATLQSSAGVNAAPGAGSFQKGGVKGRERGHLDSPDWEEEMGAGGGSKVRGMGTIKAYSKFSQPANGLTAGAGDGEVATAGSAGEGAGTTDTPAATWRHANEGGLPSLGRGRALVGREAAKAEAGAGAGGFSAYLGRTAGAPRRLGARRGQRGKRSVGSGGSAWEQEGIPQEAGSEGGAEGLGVSQKISREEGLPGLTSGLESALLAKARSEDLARAPEILKMAKQVYLGGTGAARGGASAGQGSEEEGEGKGGGPSEGTKRSSERAASEKLRGPQRIPAVPSIRLPVPPHILPSPSSSSSSPSPSSSSPSLRPLTAPRAWPSPLESQDMPPLPGPLKAPALLKSHPHLPGLPLLPDLPDLPDLPGVEGVAKVEKHPQKPSVQDTPQDRTEGESEGRTEGKSEGKSEEQRGGNKEVKAEGKAEGESGDKTKNGAEGRAEESGEREGEAALEPSAGEKSGTGQDSGAGQDSGTEKKAEETSGTAQKVEDASGTDQKSDTAQNGEEKRGTENSHAGNGDGQGQSREQNADGRNSASNGSSKGDSSGADSSGSDKSGSDSSGSDSSGADSSKGGGDSSKEGGNKKDSSKQGSNSEDQGNAQSGSSSGGKAQEQAMSAECKGRRVFVYDTLPPAFEELVTRCDSVCPEHNRERLCPNLPRDGLGRDFGSRNFSHSYGDSKYEFAPWLPTEQHMLGVLFNARVRAHACRTRNWEEADVFYIPALFGIMELCGNFEMIESMADQLEVYLQEQPGYKRRGGADHFAVVGQQVYSFTKGARNASGYGAYLLARPALSKVLFVLVERMSWDDQTHSVPYPTAFHPATEEELHEWVRFVENHPRETLVSMASGSRDGVRAAVIDACRNSNRNGNRNGTSDGDSSSGSSSDSGSDGSSGESSGGKDKDASEACKFVDCRKDCPYNFCFSDKGFCADPRTVSTLHLSSRFCLQPPGDSNTRRSIFDALIAGCIPVFFNEHAFEKQYVWHLPEDRREVSVLFDGEKVKDGSLDFIKELRSIPEERVREMQRKIVSLIPQLVFKDHTRAHPGFAIRDAFDFALDGITSTLKGRYR